MHLRDKRRFDELVRLKGMSQRTLAQRAHVTQAFISLVAHGRRGVRPETAWRIASALGVFTEELFVASPQEPPPRQPTGGFDRVRFSKRP
ncbi:helix-turn-helix transcriptional regulator [Streptomyces sp. AV19]|uniref:helix-turn-helix domain-containing protein n=1 Tax=Streptomyces sp. AV19 TaxID=2793068 RepID=UPI0018FF0DAB|nr:helix-turn-helix transcriptional regulator [Streptomyces sp. AV19]